MAYFPTGLVDFVSPREGWVLSQEPNSNVATLFHTQDSGANWSLSARVNVKDQFNIDLTVPSAKGGPSSNAQLTGQLVFRDGSAGWFVPDSTARTGLLYQTLDGGRTWRSEAIGMPAGVDAASATIAQIKFFDSTDGILELDGPSEPVTGVPGSSRSVYAYTTSDGGISWSKPVTMPTAGYAVGANVDFIDAQHWVTWITGKVNSTPEKIEVLSGGLLKTSDAGRHWSITTPASLPPGVVDVCWCFNLGFADPLHGWMGEGVFMGTSDGGAHWQLLSRAG